MPAAGAAHGVRPAKAEIPNACMREQWAVDSGSLLHACGTDARATAATVRPPSRTASAADHRTL
eukprot:1102481-Prymnesium_polylepis.1